MISELIEKLRHTSVYVMGVEYTYWSCIETPFHAEIIFEDYPENVKA